MIATGPTVESLVLGMCLFMEIRNKHTYHFCMNLVYDALRITSMAEI
jgi:hypothetical protein